MIEKKKKKSFWCYLGLHKSEWNQREGHWKCRSCNRIFIGW